MQLEDQNRSGSEQHELHPQLVTAHLIRIAITSNQCGSSVLLETLESTNLLIISLQGFEAKRRSNTKLRPIASRAIAASTCR